MGKLRVFLFTFLSTLIFSSISLGQDMEERKMNMVSLFEIDPSKEEQFKEAWKVIRDTAIANDYAYTDYVGSWRNMHWMVTPLKNFADVDALWAARNAVEEKGGRKFERAMDDFLGAMTNSHTFFTIDDADLSYWPEGAEAGSYMEIDTFYYDYGKKDEMRELLADYKALMAEKDLPYPYQVSWDSLGTEGNSVTIISYAEDAVALAQSDAAIAEAMEGDEMAESIFERYLSIATRSKTMRGKYHADISINVPEMDEEM
ncbi:hypothetical protein [Hyphococcus sp. DH-69]|uniref:hypothetical protein n=1 Tax=Hyphococcus formosus TaxID=3143534 RepID=UPI00398AFFBA